MRLRCNPCLTLLLPLLALACNDNTPTYPPIVIYGDQGNGTGNTGNSTGSENKAGNGNTGNGNGGASNSSGGAANGGADSGDSLYAHCGKMWSGDDPPLGAVQCDLDAVTDAGELSGDISADKTLLSGHSYRLKGTVRVMPGVTLTIKPCVKIIGETSDSVLAVMPGALGDPTRQCYYASGEPGPGGKLMAVGEPMAPIVFTSSKPKGSRAPSDWGGVILMGNGLNNLAQSDDGVSGTRVPVEGLPHAECFGWHSDKFNSESSGKLEYVRIEYASRKASADNETNGLTLGALGSGTELHYVMVANSGDDCFEWFGGAVNGDHLIALNCDDDEFDGDNGFSGKLQFLFGRQYKTTTEVDSRGFEIDGAPSLLTLPYTSEQVSNFTLCGGGPMDDNASRDGAVLRKNAVVSLTNGILTGFAGAGLFVQSSTGGADTSAMTYTQVFGNAHGLIAPTDATPKNNMNSGVGKAWFLDQMGNTSAEPDRFCDCWANPPVPVAATVEKGKTPKGFPDESAAYIGAFKDSTAESNWMRGAWVDWSSE